MAAEVRGSSMVDTGHRQAQTEGLSFLITIGPIAKMKIERFHATLALS